MPYYDYRCTKCGREWEDLRGASEPNPACGRLTPVSGGSAVGEECDGVVERLIGFRGGIRMAKQEVK